MQILAVMSKSFTASAMRYVNPAVVGGAIELRRRSPEVRQFHKKLPGYEPTPLRALPTLAESADVGHVYLKDESDRLGLPAFKILGASWGVYQTLCRLLGSSPSWQSIEELRTAIRPLGDISLLTATAGNHGRAVARVARWLGLGVTVLLPATASRQVSDAVAAEGADVRQLKVPYDAAVLEAFDMASRDGHYVLIQDLASGDYRDVPDWIVEGYSTMFLELDEQLAEAHATPDVLLVPTGVGSLLIAALTHYRSPDSPFSPKVFSVEPTTAACVGKSLQAGHPVQVETQSSVMAGLNAGRMTSAGWPLFRYRLDGAITVTDEAAIEAASMLAPYGVRAGPCGAASLPALHTLRSEPPIVSSSATVVLLNTEGPDREF